MPLAATLGGTVAVIPATRGLDLAFRFRNEALSFVNSTATI